MRRGEAVVFMWLAILAGIIGCKVLGWWVPVSIVASFALGTYLNYRESRWR